MNPKIEELDIKNNSSRANLLSRLTTTIKERTMDAYPKFLDRVNILLKRLQIEKGTSIDLQIFFTGHHSKEDAEGLDKVLENSDIFFPEFVAWKPDVETIYNDLSQGHIAPELAIKYLGEVYPPEEMNKINDFHREFFKKLYNSQVAIGFVDLPYVHPLHSVKSDASSEANKAFSAEHFDDMLIHLRSYLTGWHIFQTERENYIIEHIPEKAVEIINRNSALKKKTHVHLGMYLGAAHTPAYIDLRKKYGGAVRRHFPNPNPNSYTYTLFQEYIRKLNFGKSLTNEEVAQVWVFYAALSSVEDDRDIEKVGHMISKYVKRLQLSEMRDIFNKMLALNEDDEEGARKILSQYLPIEH